MKLFNRISNVTIVSLTLLFTVALTGCKNNATGNEEEHHEAPVGVVLTTGEGDNMEELLRYENKVVTDSIKVEAGQETEVITVHFLSEDDEWFQPDEPEFELRWKNTIDASIAEVGTTTDSKWSFYVVGVSQGETQIVLQLYHTGEGHSDFDTQEIPIIVN